jgi:hypothetical protein
VYATGVIVHEMLTGTNPFRRGTAIASLRAFDPYRQDQDKGDANDLVIFSNGPYMLDGEWDEDAGGTLVRNPEWDGTEDTNRQANPDSIVFQIGIEPEVIIDRLIADEGDDAAVGAEAVVGLDQLAHLGVTTHEVVGNLGGR